MHICQTPVSHPAQGRCPAPDSGYICFLYRLCTAGNQFCVSAHGLNIFYMKIFKNLLLCGLSIAVLAACNKTSDNQVKPKVTIKQCTVENNTVSCSIVPEDAVECAWYYYIQGEAQPSAQELLAGGKGVRIAPDTETKIEIPGLEWGGHYVVMAAVQSESGLYETAAEEFTISEAPDAADLGAGANCYMVTEQGFYSFTPLHVSGEPVKGIAGADWVWASKDTDSDTQELVSDVQYKGGKIFFNASGKKGNALIAAFDANGTIVWSWHIWCTDEPQTHTHGNGSVFQDRWLGATDNTPETPGSFGLLYQWGRKDPFFGGSGVNDCEDYAKPPFLVANEHTVMNPELDFKWQASEKGADIAHSASEPTTIFASGTMDWMSTQNDKLWAKTKTDYDPCPAGYRVPTYDDLSDLLSIEEKDYDIAKGGFYMTQNGTTTWWQGSGNRDYKGFLTVLGYTFAWSSATEIYPDGHFSYRFVLNDDWGCFAGIGNRTFAQSIRCVAE